MSPTPALKDWRIADVPGGQCELVGTLVEDDSRREYHTGPLRRIVGLRLVLAQDGIIYRLLPQNRDRQVESEFLERFGPKHLA